ncbi:MAG: hypothetical protein ACREI2_05640 [Nitrospiraceae bacterium]
MEQTMEASEAKADETVAHAETWRAIRFLPESEQFVTKSCSRCAGLLVNEWCHDLLDDTGGLSIEVLRCVQCGHRVDPVILWNQIRPLVANDHVRRVQHQHSVGIELSGEAA